MSFKTFTPKMAKGLTGLEFIPENLDNAILEDLHEEALKAELWVEVLGIYARIARNLLRARELRSMGSIEDAQVEEERAQRRYNRLPESMRW